MTAKILAFAFCAIFGLSAIAFGAEVNRVSPTSGNSMAAAKAQVKHRRHRRWRKHHRRHHKV